MIRHRDYWVRKRTIFWENIRHNYAIWHSVRYERIAEFINQMDGSFVLDVGCGIGLLDFLFMNKNVVGIDISSENVRQAKQIERMLKPKENGFHSFVAADLHFLPFKRKFDIIICSEVIEHLSDDRRALGAILSFLREDGFLLVTVPNLLRLIFSSFILRRGQKFMHPSHIREYRLNDVQSLVKSLSLKVDKITGAYFDFPFFYVLYIPTYVSKNIRLSRKLSFLIGGALFQLYRIFWAMLAKLFWHRSHSILVILRKHEQTHERARAQLQISEN